MESIEAEVVGTGNKRDERGRTIASASERERIVLAYEASELTQKAFARREGIKYTTLVGWLARARRGKAMRPKTPATFQELVMEAAIPTASLEVRLPTGLIIRGRCAREVAELVKALSE
jgi:transposase-like protein